MSGFTIDEIEPRLFSFTNPLWRLPGLRWLGRDHGDFRRAWSFPDDRKSLREGAVAPWAGSSSQYYLQTLESLAKQYRFRLDQPFSDLPQKVKDAILWGLGQRRYCHAL